MKPKVKADTYAKVVGYCRKVDNWNEGKKQEMADKNLASLRSN